MEWWPSTPAIYDITRSYQENAEEGPFLHGKQIPQRIPTEKHLWKDFLGHKIASSIGVPAGPLLNSRWISIASQLGYDVVTYKTIRSTEHEGHPVPNMIYVHVPEGMELQDVIESTSMPPQSMSDLAVTNSFGMPSRSRQYLQEDIPRANEALQEGQVMIVSVVGTPPGKGASPSEEYSNFVKDFADVALFAKECGAKLVEANFSCPNVVSKEGSIYQSPQAVKDVASSIVNVLGDTPLIIKVGNYTDKDLMRNVFVAAAEAKVAAICGVNSVSKKVLDPKTKESALGPNRITSGVCGGPIRSIAIDFITNGRSIIEKNALPLALIGCGGITSPEHFQEFLDAGANVATTATGMMWDPYLAFKYHHHTQANGNSSIH